MDSMFGVLIILVCTIADVTPEASPRGAAAPFRGQHVAVQWGSSITLPCFPPKLTQDLINRDECTVYWRKNGDNVATFYGGEVYYDSGLNESAALELGPDMALTIRRADWSWRGEVECKYAAKCDLDHDIDLIAFRERRVNLTVEDSPLRVRECNDSSTDQCTLSLSKDMVIFDLTFVKEGARYDAVHFRHELSEGMSVTSQSNLLWAQNSDNSTSLDVSFKVNVESLKGSGEFSLFLQDKNGETLEETTVLLQKRSIPVTNSPRGTQTHTSASGVSLAVVVPSVICVGTVIVAWFAVRHARRRRSQSEQNVTYHHPTTLELPDNTQHGPGSIVHV